MLLLHTLNSSCKNCSAAFLSALKLSCSFGWHSAAFLPNLCPWEQRIHCNCETDSVWRCNWFRCHISYARSMPSTRSRLSLRVSIPQVHSFRCILGKRTREESWSILFWCKRSRRLLSMTRKTCANQIKRPIKAVCTCKSANKEQIVINRLARIPNRHVKQDVVDFLNDFLTKHALRLGTLSFHQGNGSKNVGPVGFNNKAILHHFIHEKVNVFQLIHDIKL